jgi:hypothetical protein
MSESYLDGLLDELIPAEPGDSWDDVLRRSRRSRRRYVMLVTAAAVLVLAPATWAALKAFDGTPAPPPVRRAFNRINRYWAKQKFAEDFPLAEVRKAHGVLQVQTKDGPYALWVAPSTTGGTCYIGALKRDSRGGVQRDITEECLPHHEPPISTGVAATHGSFENGSITQAVLYGYVRGAETTVEVTMRDGRTMTLPVVEHFFLGAPRWPFNAVSITGRNAQGRVVARWKSTY